mmetsp:Transcript_32005/g.67738  ORF Transcript_32005/g.67738 Transcript_32005/m.67738 type:complete len:1028 (-) Transcript_32005:236-3319(-)|eukprot:CAMPEP_0183711280 /NCGR_PEP_ID=MMETSP0737-20130205/6818_1 /TAXON_ID=385413 /ORGANISM="Thalassiosira miniscula, Strain CCMP1093" /LENGTH=1027 /DNA_ID=CAMNT_0025939751 /DNA_START=143 /DNA_END=3226 /DNA_ORIENTATION=+
MAAAANHSHRAGKLKQQNKKNKRSSASKRSRNRQQGGKVQSLPSGKNRRNLKANDAAGSSSKAKANRVNAAKQRREASRKNAWNARRGISVTGRATDSATAALSRALSTAPPRIVGIVSLSEVEGPLEERVRTSLIGGANKKVIRLPSSITAAYNIHAKGGQPHVTLLTNTSSFRPQYASDFGEEDATVQGALDLCRVCDLVLFLIDGSTAVSVTSASSAASYSDAHSIAATSIKTSNTTAHLDHLISERGDRILSAMKAQGMPTPVTVIVHKENSEENVTDVSPLGQSVGGIDGDVMKDNEDDSDDDGMDEDTFASLQPSTTTHRSMKSIRRTYLRKRSELKRFVSRMAVTEFGVDGGSKVVELDLNGEDDNGLATMEEESGTKTTSTMALASKSQTSIAALVRMLCTISASPPSWVADVPRPYLVTEGCAGASSAVQYDEATQELKLTGYIRGTTPWNTNQPVHVPHLGTYLVKHVTLAGDAVSETLLPPIIAAGRKERRNRKGASGKDVDMADGANNSNDDNRLAVILAKSDPEERESLEMFASPDALEGEQNLIGFDDDDGDHFDNDEGGVQDKQKNSKEFQPGTSRPAGWSDYQSAWLDALGDEDEDGEDRGELAFALNKKSTDTVADTNMDDDDEVNAEEKRALLAQRRQNQKDDLQFPDEVDHEEETSARDRYARYRALKSFRKSYWDPKENLPETYGAIYHFSSFKATQRDVLGDVKDLEEIVGRRGWGVHVKSSSDDVAMEQDSDDEEEEEMARACVPQGAYVTIVLEGVPSTAYAKLSPHTLLTAISLLPHENKVSVLHMGLTSHQSEYDNEIPIKSKDVLTFRCGWRTWQSRPIFSQNNLNSDKHKFERYMPANGGSAFFAGSVFGPVTYGNSPVLMFREGKETSTGMDVKREFLAHGSIIGADADRIVLKRIILTGYPTRVHKRHATVKYMFYNPEDVKWFMPAGVTTKHGLQGNIIQSVGDHGVMKCLFNAPIKQHDTVCLSLYKRVYPKFAPIGSGGNDGEEGEGSGKHFQVL